MGLGLSGAVHPNLSGSTIDTVQFGTIGKREKRDGEADGSTDAPVPGRSASLVQIEQMPSSTELDTDSELERPQPSTSAVTPPSRRPSERFIYRQRLPLLNDVTPPSRHHLFAAVASALCAENDSMKRTGRLKLQRKLHDGLAELLVQPISKLRPETMLLEDSNSNKLSGLARLVINRKRDCSDTFFHHLTGMRSASPALYCPVSVDFVLNENQYRQNDVWCRRAESEVIL
ncbi:hypothetical protein LSAT2_006772 [Lamellibrachia satsuma]|nr:hypothetical protein LSAT2_006772 [Lamellibrachia satsuma]